MSTRLDSFETELLRELRSAVAARSDDSRQRPVPWRRLSPRRGGVIASAVAAAIGAVVIIPGVLASPAYAVQDGPDGVLEVRVNRLEDAAGLQQTLTDHGVNAQVKYLGFGLGCAPGRFHAAEAVADSATEFEVGDNGITIRLDRRDVAQGETVVIAASRITNGIHGEVAIADGPVSACEPIALSDSGAG